MRVASVRFGNVHGSRGSFIETLAYQVGHGSPVTITDLGMTRYFMTTPQAAGLVVQAAVLADSTSTFLLDMDEPHLITDLAERYAKATGHATPQLIVTGRRTGEKIGEQLTGRRETPHSTCHPQILAVRATWNDPAAVGTRNLVASPRAGGSSDELRTALAEPTEPPVGVSS